jgi:Asp-tRNA(Asn)/Glu-tRNA(Gln) amidotransferase A subunit family amidase
MHILAESLDHVGVFARDPADIALVARVLMPAAAGEHDILDTDRLNEPRIGVVRAPVWNEASVDARGCFDAWARDLSLDEEVELGDPFDDAVADQRLILDSNLAANLGWAYGSRPHDIQRITRERVRSGLTISASAFIRATARVAKQKAHLREIFRDYDALVTLAAPGEAPLGLSSTGNAVFSAIWTLMGVPVISLPLLQGENGLPIGVQLIGAQGGDTKLLGVATQIMTRSTTTQGGRSP